MKLEGVFLYYDKENGNGRIYPKEISEDIVKQFKETKSNMFGELGQTAITVPSLSPSHVVEDIWVDEEEKALKGSIRILEGAPNGVMLKDMINDFGIENFSVASRGTGTVNENKEVEDYTLISFDIIPMDKSSTKGPIKITNL